MRGKKEVEEIGGGTECEGRIKWRRRKWMRTRMKKEVNEKDRGS
jgi:hypothetical protein